MFMWIVVVVTLVAFLIYNWAEQGDRLQGRNLWLVAGSIALALAVWQVTQEAFRLHQLIAFALFLAILALGYALLRRWSPPQKRPVPGKKAGSKRLRKHRSR